MSIVSALRNAPQHLATANSARMLEAFKAPSVQGLTEASSQLGLAAKSIEGGWGSAPQAQVTRALEALDNIGAFATQDAADGALFAREGLTQAMAPRQNNAMTSEKLRETLISQARHALDDAAQKETMSIFRSEESFGFGRVLTDA